MSNNINDLIVKQLLEQQKRDRRWRNIRFFVLIVVMLLIVSMFVNAIHSGLSSKSTNEPYVALIRMQGVIMPGKSFSAENVVPALDKAFADNHAKGVILDINSGGGSPVQASIIYNRIIALRKQYPKKKVVVVGEDMMASGAYLVAMGAPMVYVNPNSVTGSIGVITEGFGFVDGMKKLGITRRVYTAGTNKDRLDPFTPVNANDVNKIKSILNQVHGYFIHVVTTSRGKRLHGNAQALFSGDFWTGMKAKQLGLVDGFGDVSSVMRSVFNVKHYKDYTPQPPFLQALVSNVGTYLDVHLQAQQQQHLLEKL